jgi:hypothetical protein
MGPVYVSSRVRTTAPRRHFRRTSSVKGSIVYYSWPKGQDEISRTAGRKARMRSREGSLSERMLGQHGRQTKERPRYDAAMPAPCCVVQLVVIP